MSKKQKILRIVIVFIELLFLVYLIKYFLPMFSQLLTEEGRITFQKTIQSLGFEGALLVIGLMCFQILIPILPGEPVEVFAGMCFGPVQGMVVMMLGALLSTLLIIGLVKLLGKSFVSDLIGKERIKKIENSKIFKDNKKIETIIFLLFFIPGLPKDILIYIAVLLPINLYKFILISVFARIPSIISSTVAGSSLVENDIIFTIGVYVVTFVISGIFIYLYNRKDKSLLEAVDEIK